MWSVIFVPVVIFLDISLSMVVYLVSLRLTFASSRCCFYFSMSFVRNLQNVDLRNSVMEFLFSCFAVTLDSLLVFTPKSPHCCSLRVHIGFLSCLFTFHETILVH